LNPPSRLPLKQFLLLTGPFNLHPPIACGLEVDRQGLTADFAGQPSDGLGMAAIETVGNAKHPGEPLDKLTPMGIERRKSPVPGLIGQCLGVISGYEGAQESILLIEAGDIELPDQVAAQLVVLPRRSP
jgi:hypothetical protein